MLDPSLLALGLRGGGGGGLSLTLPSLTLEVRFRV